MLIDIVNSHNSIVALLAYKNRGGAIGKGTFNLKFAKIDGTGNDVAAVRDAVQLLFYLFSQEKSRSLIDVNDSRTFEYLSKKSPNCFE